MNDNRFIDLVNLYVDRQITADETAELESEIQSNPRRRAIYRQYCQMHRATALVYESFRAHAPEQRGDPATGPATVARFQTRSRPRGLQWTYYAAGVATAACLALVFGQLNARKAAQLAKAESLPAVSVAMTAPAPHVVAAPASEPKAQLVSLRSNAGNEGDYSTQLASLRVEDQRALANDRIQSGRVPASLFDDGVFESTQVLPVANSRVYHSKQSPAQQTEFTAFEFQR